MGDGKDGPQSIIGARLTMILSAPAIYALIIPLVLLDLFVGFYQLACFPVYGIPRVRRRDYLAYVREVASRTEEYWCPIKHARRVLGVHSRYGSFVDFGDGDAYRHDLERLRERARTAESR